MSIWSYLGCIAQGQHVLYSSVILGTSSTMADKNKTKNFWLYNNDRFRMVT